MKKIKALLDFLKLSVSEKIEFYRNVVSKMTGNASFTSPDVPLATATTQINTLETDVAGAKSGAHQAVAKMHQSLKTVDTTFHKLATYVDRIADGNDAVIMSSGFHISKQPEPRSTKTFEVKAGENPGEIELVHKTVKGAKAYVWQYSIGTLPADEKQWIYGGATTKAKFKITGFESATKVWFRVLAVTINGTQPCSDPVMKVVP